MTKINKTPRYFLQTLAIALIPKGRYDSRILELHVNTICLLVKYYVDMFYINVLSRAGLVKFKGNHNVFIWFIFIDLRVMSLAQGHTIIMCWGYKQLTKQ